MGRIEQEWRLQILVSGQDHWNVRGVEAHIAGKLVIVVTPYLVNPVSASQIALPTDGYRGANTAERVFLGTSDYGRSGAQRPMPTMGPPRSAAPGLGGTAAVVPQSGPAPLPAPQQRAEKPPAVRTEQASAAPGFSF